MLIQKSKNQNKLKAVTVIEKKKDKLDFSQVLQNHGVELKKLNIDAWFIGNDAEQRLKEKIERIGKPLKDWDVRIFYGIKTGLNEAFIIDSKKREEILANCRDEEERKRTEAIIKPILRGRDIKRYYYEWAGLWMIIILAGWTNENRKGEKPEIFIEKTFQSLMKHLKPFEEKAKIRDYQGDYWWELRHCAYYPEFEKEKIVWQELAQGAQFSIDLTGEFFVSNTAYILTGNKLKYILGYLNSKLNVFSYERWYCTKLGEKGTRWLNQHVINIPLPLITQENKAIVNQIEDLVVKILEAKRENKTADTSQWEREIDTLVYKLYDLTKEEIRIIEKN